MKQVNLFKTIASMNETSLLSFLKLYLKDKYKEVYATDNYIYAVGDIPIGLVAHIDTVFYKPPKNIFFDSEKQVMWSPEGLGADDRAGVFAIINILIKGYRPTLIFTTGEEMGNVGAEEFVKDFPDSLSELKYLIELDRQGIDDCVFYNCGNTDFINYVNSFGFSTKEGSFSDIVSICSQWKIAGVNLSIGYFNEHSLIELLSFNYLFKTIKKVIQMLEDKDERYFSFDEIKQDIYRKKCHFCGKEKFFFDMMYDNKENYYYCFDCLKLEV